jgi:hypothetical protein
VTDYGSFEIGSKENVLRPVVIPVHGQVPVPIIRNNLKTAGISREKYFDLLEKI